MLSLASASISFSAPSRAGPATMQSSGTQTATDFARSLPGTGPFGYFDPLGFTQGEATEGRVRFLREVEVKHGRVAMLAAVGFPLAEAFHPLFGGDINVPSYIAFRRRRCRRSGRTWSR